MHPDYNLLFFANKKKIETIFQATKMAGVRALLSAGWVILFFFFFQKRYGLYLLLATPTDPRIWF